ncbi:hypothetical protein GCM10022221_10030 [Actinocorallia aurea]
MLAKRTHTLFVSGLAAGFLIVSGMVTAAVVVGLQGHAWLPMSLSGPSVIILAGLFVLRTLDTSQVKLATRLQSNALNQAQP